MRIEKVECEQKEIIKEVVSIHLDSFKGFFLTFMGKGFLREMYRSFCEHSASGLLVAKNDDGQILGFLAFSSELSGLYKYMLKKRLIVFAWYSLGAFLRKPKVFFRLFRAFLKPGESKREEKYMELSSIGVSSKHTASGVGTTLIDELKKITDFSIYEYITLETDAENNEAANGFYLKNGFKLVRTYHTHEGRAMNEYRFCEKGVIQ